MMFLLSLAWRSLGNRRLISTLTAPKVITHYGTLEDVFMSLTGRHLREE